jgi:citrate lyase subunit beta/citryl-CoA lyase
VHPSQIALAHAAYTPTEDELRRARAVLDAYQRAASDGAGAAVFDGFMIDEATRKLAVDMLVAAGELEAS